MERGLKQNSASANSNHYLHQTSFFVDGSTLEGEVPFQKSEMRNVIVDHSHSDKDVNPSDFCLVKVESFDYQENQVEVSSNDEESSCNFNDQSDDSPLDLRISTRSNRETSTPPPPIEPKNQAFFTCTYCSKTFAQKRYLITHLSVHGHRRPGAKSFKCSFCDKTFPYKHLVSKHELVHTDVKPFKCLVCSEGFRHKVSLVKHQYKHTGVKPVLCPYPGCDKTFTSRSHVKDHYRLHTGERPYACTLCDKTFVQKSALNVHLQVHAGVKPYSCYLCFKSFTSKPSLSYHLDLHAKGMFFPIMKSEEVKQETVKDIFDQKSNLENDEHNDRNLNSLHINDMGLRGKS